MSGKLLLQARKDAIKFVSAGGFEEDILLISKDGSVELAVKGLSTLKTQQFDNEGNSVNASTAHVDIPESALIEGNYPYRSGSSGKISLIDHGLIVKDLNQVDRRYVISECLPNGTTGLIVCIVSRAE